MTKTFGMLALLFATQVCADTITASTGLKITNVVTAQGMVTDFRFLPDGRIVFIQKTGEVKLFTAPSTITTAFTFAVNTTSEQGLLGVEVHPDFANTRTLFFYYSAGASLGGTDLDRHRVVSIALKADNTLDASTEKILVRGLRGPANHDGGGLAIGPDGKLYIGVGDTGCNCNCGPGTGTNTFGTCLTGGNGKILRVNLDGTIPTDNPLYNETAVIACGTTCTSAISPTVTGAPRKDIYAWGFRNPFRLSFDPVTGKLWVGDVGEVTWEEVNVVEKGKHYGWPYREGKFGQPNAKCGQVTTMSGDCVEPVFACNHSEGNCNSMTGGVFVDSCAWPDALRGQYFFGDSDTGYVSALKINATRDNVSGATPRTIIGRFGPPQPQFPVAFRIGPDGDLYVAVFNDQGMGRIAKISPVAPISCAVDAGTGGGAGGSGGGGSGGAAGGGSGGAAGGSEGVGGGSSGSGGGGTTAPKGCGCQSAAGLVAVLGLLGVLRARRRS
jgi:glucose/arabinose dehydrogenase